MGIEEQTVITPTIIKLQKQGFNIAGPYPSDTLFKKAYTKEGKYFIGMYHDQGLIPVKMLGLNKTVNISLGFPFFRISVEHGTAFDIAGKNIADTTSLRYAFDIVLRRLGFKP
jgi:4-hydroxythreonine-4-phosphate dehydrogenase